MEKSAKIGSGFFAEVLPSFAAKLPALAARWEKGAARALLRAGAEIALGALTARALVFGQSAPFGIAAVAAAPPGEGIFVLFGAVVGSLLPGGPPYPLRYVAAASAVFLLKWMLSGFEELAEHPAFAPAVGAAGAFITGCAVLLAGASAPYEGLLLLAETLLCGCATVFFGHTLKAAGSGEGILGLSGKAQLSAVFSLCVVLLAFERAGFAGISFGRILALTAVLCAARYGREAGGAVAGAAAGVMLSLGGAGAGGVQAGAAVLPGAYAFGGLIGGIFGRLGRLPCAAALVLGNCVAMLSAGQSVAGGSAESMLPGLYEACAAAFLFCVLPEKWLCRAGVAFAPSPARGEGARHVREAVAQRLTEAAAAIEEISGTVGEVSGRLAKTAEEDLSGVFAGAAGQTCKKCGLRMYCWVKTYNDTMDALNAAADVLRQRRTLERGDLPGHFAARCSRADDLVASVNRCYAEYAARREAGLKTEQLRRLLIPQLGGTSALLRSLAEELKGLRRAPGGERVRTALASCGVGVRSSELRLDARGRLTVEAEVGPGAGCVSGPALTGALSAACGRALDGPEAEEDEDGGVRLLFREKPRYSVQFGEAAIQKTGESLCGDACETFVDAQGRAVLIVSDGMGCGGGAAVDAGLTVELTVRLLQSGFGFDEAAQVAGTAMLVKSGDESFSTLDIACIDLYDGTTTFLKAGAPPAYVRRSGRVERVEPCSMPLGILPGVRLERADLHLREGDVVLVVSDGAASGDDGWLVEALENFSGDPRPFARQLAQLARQQRSDGHDDDITVLAAVIGTGD